ncbi:laminin subunit gamma-3 [Pangasianodon hypophthalmus]|uniref:laminin subunit gamma-3 n=1 Tax=Pangasianodon hypophthalmus TaxID=310915 RepID=UPI002307D91E|nr:laminin subunit gamma-3 [Pangasianodon hypophthalmus]
MYSTTFSFAVSILFLLFLSYSYVFAGMDSCHDEEGTPSVCMPKFENAAFNRTIIVSNVCGSPPEDYCMQTGSTRSCRHCDASDFETNHNATYLNDFHSDEEPTWWQSQSMFYGVQYPNSVNLTLHLGKAYEITYVRLKFYTSRPESFAIYKRTNETASWQPYQYYSASCRKTYGRDSKGFIRPGDEERTALCTDEFSDISPLTGGNVAFSTLEGRPSAYNFDQSPVLQEWVTATDLLISLNRLNTFGDEFFKDAKVLRSYFYAISDFSVGGRCKCNGHASECVPNEQGRLVCVCEHYTAGTDCQHCATFYRDRPWARATADSANQCVKCNCSGRADECVFDAEQYRSTGSGGRCIGCRDNTAGPHCERCRENFYRSSPLLPCNNCSCNTMGSVSLQCHEEGVCLCRPSVMGVKCDVCRPGFHSLGPGGCRLCECDERGSVGVCSAGDGRCHCKSNVEGHSCGRCKPGSFNLQLDNPHGCQMCFCFGHSLACSSSNQHVTFNITSNFLEDTDGWLGEFSGHQEASLIWKEGEVYLLPYSEEDVGYYKAPAKFLGNQLLSYGQHLTLSFTAESSELLPKIVTVALEGSGLSVSANLFSKQYVDSQPSHTPRNIFTLRLTETEVYPSLTPFEFRRLLNNLTALHISNVGGQNYTSQLSGVTLTSATLAEPYSDIHLAPPAPWVEMCACPPGFMGQFCELCAPGFTRDSPNGGPYSPCVPCNCNQHGTCHPETGVCDCTDFTTGPSCERCQDGYYGNALTGSPGDCAPCPCPGRTTCAQMPETGEVVCTNCPAGQRGIRCELCEDGFYGDPLGWQGEVRLCVRCECNENTDPNAVGVCDHVTGRCLKCLGHTDGDHCEKCQSGYYGNALDRSLRPSQKCLPCLCNPAGTLGSVNECDPHTGRCLCLRHVTGRDCGQCEFGYFNLRPGLGCDSCNCNPIGSPSLACHPITGQCTCRTGIKGKMCDACQMGFFGFSSRGCRACNCDPMGSASMQCHANGTCPCRQGFVGYKCDKCELNHYQNPLTHQCEECPVCYSLIRDQVTKLKSQLHSLERLLSIYDCKNFRHRIYVRPNHVRQHHRLENHLHEHQGEDYLPNALEEFLAIQEAREAFISQFTQLETSAQALQLQLHDFASIMNCSLLKEEGSTSSEEENRTPKATNECKALVETFAAVTESQAQLQEMTSDLNSLVIPFIIPKGPTEWNALVNESEALVKSHKEMAAHIEGLAGEALKVSNKTYSVLLDLLEDNSTERHLQALTERLSEMQQLKENLTRQANETHAAYLSMEELNKEAEAILQNVTSTLPNQPTDINNNLLNTTAAEELNEADNTIAQDTQLIQRLDLANRTAELDLLIQSKQQLLNKSREELEPRLENARNNLNTTEEFQQLTAFAQGLRETALTSVVEGKKIESEAFSLHRHAEGLEKEWPVVRTQTRAALKREGVVEEKILTEVKKKVRHAERVLRPALENATQARDTATQAQKTANAIAKDAKASLSRGKQTRKVSVQLKTAVNAAVQQLTEQENLAAHVAGDVQDEADVSLKGVMGSMESAKSQLEGFTHMLAELLGQIERNTDVEKYDRVLNETASRLKVLRGSVESPALNRKFQMLLGATEDQQKQLMELEKSLQDIREERDSLTDIAQNLPKTCPERS